MKIKVCPICLKQFVSRKDCKSRIQIYCSLHCYGQTIAKYKKCGYCEKDFYNYNNSTFCSRKCSNNFKRGKSLDENHRKALSKVKLGKKIKHLLDETGNFKKEIREKISKAQKGRKYPERCGEAHFNWKGGITNLKRNCALCGKEFISYNTKCCSNEHALLYRIVISNTIEEGVCLNFTEEVIQLLREFKETKGALHEYRCNQ